MKQHTLYEREQTIYDTYDYDRYESDDECKKFHCKITNFPPLSGKKKFPSFFHLSVKVFPPSEKVSLVTLHIWGIDLQQFLELV